MLRWRSMSSSQSNNRQSSWMIFYEKKKENKTLSWVLKETFSGQRQIVARYCAREGRTHDELFSLFYAKRSSKIRLWIASTPFGVNPCAFNSEISTTCSTNLFVDLRRLTFHWGGLGKLPDVCNTSWKLEGGSMFVWLFYLFLNRRFFQVVFQSPCQGLL